MVSKKFIIKAPIWNGTDRCIGIAPFRLKNNSLRVTCGYKNKQGNKIWEGELYVSKTFASKYPIKEYKWGKCYVINLQELIEYNEWIDKKRQEMMTTTWSKTYTKTEINEILLKNPNISDICKMFPGTQIEPNPS